MSARDPRIPVDFLRAMKGEAIPLPVDPGVLRFPLYGSTKIDGVRATSFHAELFSYSLKPFRNRRINTRGLAKLSGVDGELTIGPANAPDVCKRTTSALDSFDGDVSELTWNVFDWWDKETGYTARLQRLEYTLRDAKTIPWRLQVRLVKQKLLRSMQELEDFEAATLADGWEGVMLRDPSGLYKMGRSTIKDGALVKLKRFSDMEARVVGVYEMQHNGNAAEIDAAGRTKRSSAKAGKSGLGVLGGFEMVGTSGPFAGVSFRVGGGFTDAERREYWERRAELIGKIGTVKFLGHGADQRPRHPTWKLFRLPGDK